MISIDLCDGCWRPFLAKPSKGDAAWDAPLREEHCGERETEGSAARQESDKPRRLKRQWWLVLKRIKEKRKGTRWPHKVERGWHPIRWTPQPPGPLSSTWEVLIHPALLPQCRVHQVWKRSSHSTLTSGIKVTGQLLYSCRWDHLFKTPGATPIKSLVQRCPFGDEAKQSSAPLEDHGF